MNDSREYDLRLMDKYLESAKVYWSSLLTINGILLSFFSIDSLSSSNNSKGLGYVLIILCVFSIWLIILNFRAIKSNYLKLGQQTIDDMPYVPEDELANVRSKQEESSDLIDRHTESWRRDEIKKAHKTYLCQKYREITFELLMIIETLLVLCIVLTG